MVKSDQKTAILALCLVLFAVAMVLRAVGADYGYFNGDERVNDSARFLAGELIPTQHFYPPFFNYLNGVAFVGLFVFGLLTDMWSSTSDFRQAYFDDPTPFYLTARYVTAAIGALSAPLFFSCARRVGLSLTQSLAVGLFAAVFPIAVFMAHIAKGDTGLAVGCLAVVWAFLQRIDTPNRTRWDILLGITVALAFSFKQSALLVLGPAGLAMLLVLARREGSGSALASFGRALLVFLMLWPIMNIGILLDIEGFLTFQKIQAVMSVRADEGFGIGLPITFAIFGSALTGLNPIGLAFAALVPVWLLRPSCRLRLRDGLVGIWVANLASTVIISLLVGTRQPEHLFLPNLYLFLLLSSIVVIDMIRVYVSFPRAVVALTAVAGFGLMVASSGNILKQALAKPVAHDLVAFLEETYPTTRIQSALALPVPKTLKAQQLELDRMERLGKKYGVELPEMAPERLLTEDPDNALFWVDVPFPMSGLESDDAKDADFPVVAHAWPIQPEEWTLDAWVENNFRVFVVNELDFFLNDSRSSDIRAFYAELVARCDIAQQYPARKPLFLEFEVTVFDCSMA